MWEDAPIVEFVRDGDAFTLGRRPGDAVIHMTGSEGLGLAPVEVDSAERLGGDGSVYRGMRYGEREVFLPLAILGESMSEVNETRRRLADFVAPDRGMVWVRVTDPLTGEVREIEGLYTEGLEGTYGDQYRATWQTLGVRLWCPDPWWKGPERIRTFRVAPGTKPFISQTVPFFPVVLAPSNVVGEFEVAIRGDGEVWPSWEIVGPGSDLVIARGDERIFLSGVLSAGTQGRIEVQRDDVIVDPVEWWPRIGMDASFFSLRPGENRLRIEMTGGSTESAVRLVWRERYRKGY